MSVLFPSCLPSYCLQCFYGAIFSSNEPINKWFYGSFPFLLLQWKPQWVLERAYHRDKHTNKPVIFVNVITCVTLIRRALTTWTHSSPCQCQTTARRSLRVVTCTTQTATGCSIHRVCVESLKTWITACNWVCLSNSNWIFSSLGRTEDGKKELIFLSNRNPSMFERLCASLWAQTGVTIKYQCPTWKWCCLSVMCPFVNYGACVLLS